MRTISFVAMAQDDYTDYVGVWLKAIVELMEKVDGCFTGDDQSSSDAGVDAVESLLFSVTELEIGAFSELFFQERFNFISD